MIDILSFEKTKNLVFAFRPVVVDEIVTVWSIGENCETLSERVALKFIH